MAVTKEWTIMFFFAGDNPLAPYVVHQLKHIKDAGFQKSTDVLVYFDSNAPGVPTRIYDVNQKRKKERIKERKAAARKRTETKPESEIGDGRDSFVRTLRDDIVTADMIDLPGDAETEKLLRQMLLGERELEAEEALKSFLTFCREQHTARRYILFLVGHGMIVGNDTFLPDDNPISAITLNELGVILHDFADKVKEQKGGGALELVGLHSCSMSGIEVAYELKGSANFMMASQGPSFAGDWHYRQILKRSFTFADDEKPAKPGVRKRGGEQSDPKILRLIESLYFRTLFSTRDGSDAGYSHDLTLCSLDEEKYDGPEGLTTLIKNLVVILREGILQSRPKDGSQPTPRGKRIRDLVQLAHLESQSYWAESYTDLFDFCQLLSERCDPKVNPEYELGDIHGACAKVMDKLKPAKKKELTDDDIKKESTDDEMYERFKSLIIHSENFGWEFQYSHGLSIYFPWSKPIETTPGKADDKEAEAKKDGEVQEGVLQRYEKYKFTEDLGTDSWFSFLTAYLDNTERLPLVDPKGRSDVFKEASQEFVFAPQAKTDRVFPQLKIDPGQGADCACPSLKNFPKDEERQVNGKTKRNLPLFAATEEALKGVTED
ncbi:MAG TPA: clostripain-related cysteine peptidase [Blastocatellia bacterium]|nr:clostripain-related cysteine peptidase [Blastocatellia bacterium]